MSVVDRYIAPDGSAPKKEPRPFRFRMSRSEFGERVSIVRHGIDWKASSADRFLAFKAIREIAERFEEII